MNLQYYDEDTEEYVSVAPSGSLHCNYSVTPKFNFDASGSLSFAYEGNTYSLYVIVDYTDGGELSINIL